MLVSEASWLYIWSEVASVIPLLQSFVDKETPLGETIIEMFNPDVARTVKMNELQVNETSFYILLLIKILLKNLKLLC